MTPSIKILEQSHLSMLLRAAYARRSCITLLDGRSGQVLARAHLERYDPENRRLLLLGQSAIQWQGERMLLEFMIDSGLVRIPVQRWEGSGLEMKVRIYSQGELHQRRSALRVVFPEDHARLLVDSESHPIIDASELGLGVHVVHPQVGQYAVGDRFYGAEMHVPSEGVKLIIDVRIARLSEDLGVPLAGFEIIGIRPESHQHLKRLLTRAIGL